ncbi:hypothetical protein O6H91_22G068400 [Diphasiastrum complanatum]|uniref:Uncharacterized protein n=1 Tax=Diphasiastrum complanatum TaxID=34168 RepID=A0ACC2AGM4_DIPCM|nr:hypothetical protein O6H91_22G068400 [Diphasiastrum complanatum]
MQAMVGGGRLPLFDAHCHLQDPRIAHCMPHLLTAAVEAGVRWFAVNGTSEQDWDVVRKMGDTYPTVIPCFGLHPWYVANRSPSWFSTLQSKLEAVPTAAVGEVGLDKGSHCQTIDFETQVEVLKKQLQLAQTLQRPVAVHCVNAFGSLQDILQEMGTFPAGIIMHSYSGPAEMVRMLAKYGAYFSFSGFFTSMKVEKAKQVLLQVPLDRILLETDAPDAFPRLDPSNLYWVPEDHASSSKGSGDNSNAEDHAIEGLPNLNVQHNQAGGTEKISKSKVKAKIKSLSRRSVLNHPSNIYALLSYISSLLGMSEEELSHITFGNAMHLYSFSGSKVV